MKAEEYHKSLAPLEEACRIAGWGFLTCPLTGGRLMILLRHFSLIFKIYKIRNQRILFREFSTLPLLLVFPLLWPLRKNICFLIHHNIQWAVRNSLERFALKMLARLGARWALFETQNFPNLGKFNIPSSRNLVLLHPVLSVGQTFQSAQPCGAYSVDPIIPSFQNNEIIRLTPQGKSGAGSPIIGVAGAYRAEKGIDALIGLLKEKCPEFGILLGVPNPQAAAHLDVEIVSTASQEDYFRMIARCDVLVFNGEKNSYFYRASGPVADAAACGTAVVVPDFPILGKQADGIGEVFQSLEAGSAGMSLPEAVHTAVEKARAGRYHFETYCAARSAQMIAKRLDQ